MYGIGKVKVMCDFSIYSLKYSNILKKKNQKSNRKYHFFYAESFMKDMELTIKLFPIYKIVIHRNNINV